MREVFEKNNEFVVKSLREEKQAWLLIDDQQKLIPKSVKAFRYNEDADFIEVIDHDGNFWCVYYAPSIGVVIEDSMPKAPIPGEGWELLFWK